MGKFWRIDKCDLDVKNEINSIYGAAKQMTKLMIVILGVTVSGFAYQPLFGTRKLLLKGFYPQDTNRSPDYELALLSQITMAVVAMPLLFGFDGLLISFILNIICELKVLQRELEKMPIDPSTKGDTKKVLVQLYKLIDHHNLILKYCLC